ncbi:MAG: COX15/CtaA family protein [Leptospiraceae bacterium]|nr:COX15/CtaA family protein [Leptospiraceae bacterium]
MNQDRENFQIAYKAALILAILTFLNILFGPMVRATDSGLACPDWPLCYGKFIPPPEFRIWMEVGHRFYSGIISIILLLLVIKVFRTKVLTEKIGTLTIVAIGVIAMQIILGMLTVTKLLDPTTVNLHLLNAVLFLLTIITIAIVCKIQLEEEKYPNSKFRFTIIFQNGNGLLVILFLLIYYQMFLGGRVSSHYAGLICGGFPLCNGEWFPKMTGLVRYHMEHRITAYLIFFLLLWYYIKSLKVETVPILKKFAGISLLVCVVQIILGIVNVLYGLPVIVTGFHTGTAALLLVSVYISLYLRMAILIPTLELETNQVTAT